VEASGGGTGATLDPAGAVWPVASVGCFVESPLVWAMAAAGMLSAAIMVIIADRFISEFLLFCAFVGSPLLSGQQCMYNRKSQMLCRKKSALSL
jgi:hypothetical protein